MKTQRRTLWDTVSLLPVTIAVTGFFVFGLLHLNATISDPKLFLILASAFAELCMILAGVGGIAYLFNPHKSPQARRWLWLNIGLFFVAAFSGLLFFMAL